MPDPIQGVNTSGPIGTIASGQAGASQASAASSAATPAAAIDQADVGGTAALLTTIAEAASEVPTIDETRVAALQQAIAAGTYQVDPQKIAEGLMQLESGIASGGGGA